MTSPRNLRRSARIKPIVRYAEDSFEENRKESSPPIGILKTEVEKQLEDIKEDVQKPLELFSDKDVSGQKLYTFQTPTKRNSMMLKANQCRTPETPKSFKTLPTLRIVLDQINTKSPRIKNLESDKKSIKIKISRKRCLSSVNSSDDESISKGEYTLANLDSSSDKIFNGSNKSENSDKSDKNNTRKRGKQSKLQKPLPKCDIQDTPKRTTRKRCLPSVNSSGDESISEDSEYMPTDAESSSDKILNGSNKSENSEKSDKNNIRRRGKQSRLQKPLPKCDTQDTPKRTTRKLYFPSVNSSGDESISEDSEYIPTDTESNSDETSNGSKENENSDKSDEENNTRRRNKQSRLPEKPLPKLEIQNTPRRMTRSACKSIAYKDYHIKTDEYFATQSEKAITSDHTLSRLRNARLTEGTLDKLLKNQNHISTLHKKRICSLTDNYKSFFSMWQFIMEEGYSLLIHGLGSKRNLINDFHNEIIADHPTLVINGFFPSLSIKDILDNIIVDILDLSCPTNPNDCLELIEKVLRDNPDDRLYLIIHNIDGIMLRSSKAQNILAGLATIPNIKIIASVDHVNAPLLWDHIKRAKFNFYWWDATTFFPYQAETAYESSLLVQQSGGLALSSLQNVFLSLTSNARTIYLILVKYQLDNSSSNFTGMPFKDLYRAAREQFLVSSDLALRAQLTEFVDHKLVRTKRTYDGAEHLTIPLDKSLLKQFMEQHGS